MFGKAPPRPRDEAWHDGALGQQAVLPRSKPVRQTRRSGTSARIPIALGESCFLVGPGLPAPKLLEQTRNLGVHRNLNLVHFGTLDLGGRRRATVGTVEHMLGGSGLDRSVSKLLLRARGETRNRLRGVSRSQSESRRIARCTASRSAFSRGSSNMWNSMLFIT